jgi:hypothetical protein
MQICGTQDAVKNMGSIPLFARRIDNLRADIEIAKRRREALGRLRWIVPLSAVIVAAAAIGGGAYFQNTAVEIFGAIYLIIGLIFPLLPFSSAVSTEIEAMESELALISTGVEATEQRAERLFRSHEIDVRRYYQQTLRHTNLIFITGLVCIGLGFAITGFSLYSILRTKSDGIAFQEKILIASFGIAAGILSNFIAVIYLRMFSETLKSLTEFHQKLVSTNNLYFSNFLMTKILSQELRDRTLADIALRVSQIPGEQK